MQVQVETNCSPFDYAMNEAWVTIDGNPPQPVFVGINGPPTALANTFLMNPGDRIQVVLKDTPDGLTARVIDKTNDTVGYATASSKFGFNSVTPLFMGCNSVPWSFRPLWNTATAPTSTSPGHTVPWALAILNVGFGLETGHFEIKDFDTDDRLIREYDRHRMGEVLECPGSDRSANENHVLAQLQQLAGIRACALCILESWANVDFNGATLDPS
jgi:hypothetical protein